MHLCLSLTRQRITKMRVGVRTPFNTHAEEDDRQRGLLDPCEHTHEEPLMRLAAHRRPVHGRFVCVHALSHG